MNYYVFHRNGIPLLLLPSDKRAALKTLSLYLPQSTKAKLAHAFLYTICTLGITRFFLKRATVGELTQNIIKFYKTKEPDASLGFLVCNPDHGERVIALKYTKHHSSIVKATTLDKKESLLKEYENIRRFSGTPGVPFVHSPITTESCIMLEMPYYRKSRIKSLGDKRIQTLLTNWKQKTLSMVTLPYGT